MLGRVLSGAGMMRAGVSLMRKGQEMRARAKNAPIAAASAKRASMIAGVKLRTRGIAGVSKPALFSKTTAAGRSRRLAAATAMKHARGASLTSANFGSFLAGKARLAQQARSRAIVKKVQGYKYQAAGHTSADLSKKTSHGRFSRHLVAQHLKAARLAPVAWGGTKSLTMDLRRKKP